MARGAVSEGAIAAVDAANFVLEGAQPNVVTLAGLLAPGGFVDAGGVPDLDRLRVALAERVKTVPALCRRPSARGSAWVWERADPDLQQQVRVVGGSRGFEAVCARALMTPLSPDLPLWELLLAPGVDGDCCGILFRLHHALADGQEAAALIAVLTDDPAEARRHPAVDRSPVEPLGLWRRASSVADQTIAVFRRTVRSRVLLGPLGATRDVAFLDVGLADLHGGAKRLGGTVGDAFLTAFGQGLRALLTEEHDIVPETLPVSCPVELPRRSGAGNATGVMLVPVPVATGDVRAALRQVAAATRSEKARARAAGVFEWMSGPHTAAMLMRFARTQRAVAAIASEFPGPTTTLRLAGSELVRAWPLSLLSGDVRVGVVGASYAGRFRVSVQPDAEHLPPARVVADAMAAALLSIAAEGQGRSEAAAAG